MQHVIKHLDTAFKNMFAGRAKFPRFKSRHDQQSLHIPAGIKVDFAQGRVFVPKFKYIDVTFSQEFKGQVRNATLSKTPTGKYHISILVDTQVEGVWVPLPEKKPIQRATTVGLDVGLAHFVTLSNGEKIENPKHLFNALAQLKRQQRTMSRRYNKNKKHDQQSKNYYKQKLKVAHLHERVANRRRDFLHKTSTTIVKVWGSVAMEDLNIKGMVKNHKLARSISDVGWGMFKIMVKYKCEWSGKNFEPVGRFEPTSKKCSTCGHKRKKLALSVREWTCEACASMTGT